jgi:pyruvate formate lyase activating enzyme
MHGIIYDIKRFAVHDGPGLRTTVFMKGCPLRCAWCHNPESIDPKPLTSMKKMILDGCVMEQEEVTGKAMTTIEVLKVLRREQIFMEEGGGGVTFSGGEPLFQTPFLEDMLISCRAEGMHTAVDTSGQSSWTNYERIAPLVQLFLFDVKHIDDHKHREFTGVSNKLILENLQKLIAGGANIRIRVPVIPGFNSSVKEQKAISKFIAGLNGNIEQVDLLPYHAIASHKYSRFGIGNRMKGVRSLTVDEVATFTENYIKKGIKVSIGG